MIGTVIRELLELYFLKRANYVRYFVWLATIIGLSLLAIVNFLYFIENDREIGVYLLLSTTLIGIAAIVYFISILSGRRMAGKVIEKIELVPARALISMIKQLSLIIPNKKGLCLLSIVISFLLLTRYKKEGLKRKFW